MDMLFYFEQLYTLKMYLPKLRFPNLYIHYNNKHWKVNISTADENVKPNDHVADWGGQTPGLAGLDSAQCKLTL